MTSDIAAPTAGAVDAAGGLLPDGPVVVVADGWVVVWEVWVCPEWLLLRVEHAATSPPTRKGTATRTAIRIPSG
jgi:hypothetical protein